MFYFHKRLTLAGIMLCLALLVVSCQLFPSPGTSKTPTSSPAHGVTPTTVPMPPTETSCPTVGTARAAVMFPLLLGNHANVVYVYNKGRGSTPHPLGASLKRYDATTSSATVVMTVTNASIDQAQLSSDGQWVLFTTQVSGRSALQLVRMDGQGQQTLYCAASNEQIGAIAWSPDQGYVAFQEGMNVYLLKIATGTYQLKVHASTTMYYVLRTWLDTTHLYLAGIAVGTEPPPLNLYLLDITTGKVQQILTSPALCGDFDRSIEGHSLFTSECQFVMPMADGPSSIQVRPATGGPAKTIYTTPSYAITSLRVASASTLLFVIHNTGVGAIDTSHNGLWKVNTDGTGLSRLTDEAADDVTVFPFTRTPWSVISRNGGNYAIQVDTYAPSTPGIMMSFVRSSLLIGSLSGGQPVAFVTLAHNTGTIDTLDIVGWTTM